MGVEFRIHPSKHQALKPSNFKKQNQAEVRLFGQGKLFRQTPDRACRCKL